MKSFQYHTPPCGGARQGFSLLEMSIVLIIIAMVVGGGVTLFSASVKKQQLQETQTKLTIIQKALLDYRRAYNRLPCPSDFTQAIGSTTFGTQAGKVDATSTTDYDCMGSTPVANYKDVGALYLFEGGVPVRTLKLPDEYAYDGWGRVIDYSVAGHLTANSAFTTYPITDSTTRFEIRGANAVVKTTKAVYALVSYGANGHGAYTRAGTGVINAGSTNTDELLNCDCLAAGTRSANIDGIFVQKPVTLSASDVNDSFDDVVVYATRADLSLPTE